ncbi:MAG TPA: hypothetical protein VLJ59_19190 [Mycobacteriales bacterium]|nr:hypothetical protein [Mycobacteriales bacterium]
MTNTLRWRAIYVPSGTGRIGFVDPADVAAVAAHVLTTPATRARPTGSPARRR